MIIYFVCKSSKLKGPFDITDANRRHIIGVGDICIRETDKGLCFLIVQSTSNKWGSCMMCEVGKREKLTIHGNTLLFSFDGISKRFGMIKQLESLMGCFAKEEVINCIKNAIDILDYKVDYWEVGIFAKLLSLSPVKASLCQEHVANTVQHPDLKYPALFVSYLPTEARVNLLSQLEAGHTLKESYAVVRKLLPSLYRSAFLKFTQENPSKSIFD